MRSVRARARKVARAKSGVGWSDATGGRAVPRSLATAYGRRGYRSANIAGRGRRSKPAVCRPASIGSASSSSRGAPTGPREARPDDRLRASPGSITTGLRWAKTRSDLLRASITPCGYGSRARCAPRDDVRGRTLRLRIPCMQHRLAGCRHLRERHRWFRLGRLGRRLGVQHRIGEPVGEIGGLAAFVLCL
ncbi:hypothetical protein ABIA03_003559 [Bradyrhizobium yuanmingense]|uniref:Uncharacterized protein n=1 Tax=Bradyrhizobium yuanmingense TaxID=108015 RepID=A0ABV4GF26_9BRAD